MYSKEQQILECKVNGLIVALVKYDGFFCYFTLFSYCYITHCKPCLKVYIYFQIQILLAGNDMFKFPLEVWKCIGNPFHSLNDQKYISPYNIGGLASSQVVRRLKNII